MASVIASMQGRGQPLPLSERTFFEPRFGKDFSQVRIHTGSQAAEAARALNAQAFTVGLDVVFGAGQYASESVEGKRLLAHELTHVLQQGNGALSIGPPEGSLDRKIDGSSALTEGSCVGTGALIRVSPGPLSIQRFLTVNVLTPQTENLAERVMAGRSTAGFVAYWLNNKRIDAKPSSATEAQVLADLKAAAVAAIKRPDVDYTLKNVVGPHGPEIHGDAWIKSVSNNVLETEAHWLTPPPWTMVTTKGEVGRELYLGICSGTDQCTLTVNGKPDETTMATQTQAHENQHEKDIITAFNTFFKPWDDQITLAWETGKVFSGQPKQVNSDLWNFLGGSPEEIATKFIEEVQRLGKLLHAGLSEPKIYLKNNKAGPGCNTAFVDAEGGK